jgi:uncharacterized protein YciI
MLSAVLAVLGVVVMASTSTRVQPDLTPQTRDYVFVFITTGPAKDLSPEQTKAAFEGHFANMARMADEGTLLVAGPFMDPKTDPDHRGLWVFEAADVAAALEHGATDPAVQAGIFVINGHVLTTDAPLRALPALEKVDEQRRVSDPDVPDAWEGRAFVLATAPASAELELAVRETDAAIIVATLRGAGPDGGDLLIAWLDATDADAARELLPEPETWSMHGWYGSPVVAQIRPDR